MPKLLKKVEWGNKHKQLDDQTSCKQAYIDQNIAHLPSLSSQNKFD